MTLTKDTMVEMIRDKIGFPIKEAKDILAVSYTHLTLPTKA